LNIGKENKEGEQSGFAKVTFGGAKVLRNKEGVLTSAPKSLIFSFTTVLQK